MDHQVNETWQLRQNARYGTIDLEYDSLYGTGLDPFDPTQRLMGRRAFFSDENVDQFVIDNQPPAYRLLTLHSNGAIDTGVHFLTAAESAA